MNKRQKQYLIFPLILGLGISTTVRAERILSGDEVKELITDKTVYVTRHRDGKQWKAYFFADGSAFLDVKDMKKDTWHIDKKGRHCNTGVRLVCAPIQDNGDGTYSRLKPNGKKAVTWTKIVDGKDF
jgi:hypothetical protein